MNRNIQLVIVLTMIVTLCVPTEARQPNIVLIMADDVSWEAFGCYGAEDYQTPHLDRLASKGVRFQHCYSTPLCTPSRVQIMTGKYNFRNYTHFGYLNPREKTFGNLLQNAGYKTAIAGKWQLSGLYNKKEFPDHGNTARPYQAGFNEYCLWQLTHEKKEGERFWSPMLEINGKTVTPKDNRDQYGPDIMCNFLCDFMERHQEQPFFAYYPMVLVHDPFVPTPDTIGDALRTQAANKAPKDKAQKKANFVAMVNYMDKLVGRIVKKVDTLGLLENTLIIFTGDNGTNRSIQSQWKGQTIVGGKGGLKDMGTHVPLIAFWKGQTLKGAVLEDLVDFTDVYPTLAHASGVRLGNTDPRDGRSVLPQMRGQRGASRDWVLCHYQPYWGPAPGLFARTARFKLHGDGRFDDVPVDLNEENDLAGSIPNGRVRAVHHRLQALLDRCPSVPPGKGNKSVDRPVHPDWERLDLND